MKTRAQKKTQDVFENKSPLKKKQRKERQIRRKIKEMGLEFIFASLT